MGSVGWAPMGAGYLGQNASWARCVALTHTPPARQLSLISDRNMPYTTDMPPPSLQAGQRGFKGTSQGAHSLCWGSRRTGAPRKAEMQVAAGPQRPHQLMPTHRAAFGHVSRVRAGHACSGGCWGQRLDTLTQTAHTPTHPSHLPAT